MLLVGMCVTTTTMEILLVRMCVTTTAMEMLLVRMCVTTTTMEMLMVGLCMTTTDGNVYNHNRDEDAVSGNMYDHTTMESPAKLSQETRTATIRVTPLLLGSYPVEVPSVYLREIYTHQHCTVHTSKYMGFLSALDFSLYV